MRNKIFFLCCVLLLFIAILYFSKQHPSQSKPQTLTTPSVTITQITSASASANVLGVRTKSVDCQVNGPIQDKDCTPGDIFPNATKDQICVPGYSKSVRNVSDALKKAVYEEYGIVTRTKGAYEVDHLISLELGGSNDIANLWPEAADPRPGFHEKDFVENYLHDRVCRGAMTLKDAQAQIANDWMNVYRNISP